MYYLEILDSPTNLSNEIGDHNSFDNMAQVYEAIGELEEKAIKRSETVLFVWRVLDDEGDSVEIIRNNYVGHFEWCF